MKSVFIGGCPRSGTTLLGSILGSHSLCVVTPESQFKIDEIEIIKKCLNEKQYHTICEVLNKNDRFRIWDTKINYRDISKINKYSDLLFYLVKQYNNKYNKLSSVEYWIDHTPSNIKFASRIIHELKESKFIHIIRDGRAVISSVKKLDWGPNTAKAGVEWWLENLSYGLALNYYLPKDKFMMVKFENLLINPSLEVKKICDFIGITFEKNMILGNGFKVPKYTYNQHEMVGQKPSMKVIDKWRKDLNKREIEIIELISRDMLDYLGYKKCFDSARQISLYEKIKCIVLDRSIRFINGFHKSVRSNKIK